MTDVHIMMCTRCTHVLCSRNGTVLLYKTCNNKIKRTRLRAKFSVLLTSGVFKASGPRMATVGGYIDELLGADVSVRNGTTLTRTINIKEITQYQCSSGC